MLSGWNEKRRYATFVLFRDLWIKLGWQNKTENNLMSGWVCYAERIATSEQDRQLVNVHSTMRWSLWPTRAEQTVQRHHNYTLINRPTLSIFPLWLIEAMLMHSTSLCHVDWLVEIDSLQRFNLSDENFLISNNGRPKSFNALFSLP